MTIGTVAAGGGLAAGAHPLGAYDPTSRIFGPVTGRGSRTARTPYRTVDAGYAFRPLADLLAA